MPAREPSVRDSIHTTVEEFFAQALATELGGAEIYKLAIECAQNEELREEWEKYLDETEEHIALYTKVIQANGMDPENMDFPAVVIVQKTAASLLDLMRTARATADADAAQIVAAECIVSAESKCHLNWELVGELGKKMKGPGGDAVREAYEEVHEQENEHLFHTTGWARELWIQRLGMKAVLPPPEEERHVKTAIGAEKAKNARTEML